MKHARTTGTTGERWHDEAERNRRRDGVALILTVVCIFTGLLVVSALYTNYQQSLQQKAAVEASIKAAHADYIRNEALDHQRHKDQWASIRANLDILREADAQREAERIAAEEAAYQEWLASQYVAPSYYQAPYDTSDGISASEFQWMGVIETEDHVYTYYSERVLPGGGLSELNDNGRHSEDGFVKDGDGYIAVASSDLPKGSIVDTPFGEGKVYDTGSLAPGQVDIYVSF